MKKKKITSILLTASLLAGLAAGCGGPGKGGSDSSIPGGTELVAGEYDGTIKLPLSEEPVTLKIWLTADANFFTVLGDYNESEFFQEMEKRQRRNIQSQ